MHPFFVGSIQVKVFGSTFGNTFSRLAGMLSEEHSPIDFGTP